MTHSGSEGYCVANAVLMAIALNIALPLVLSPHATMEEKMPPSGSSSLSPKGQFMHMMVHHKQVPLMSSFIVALITALAVFLGYKLKPASKLMSFL